MTIGNYLKKEGVLVDSYSPGEISLIADGEYAIGAIDRRMLQYSIDLLLLKMPYMKKL